MEHGKLLKEKKGILGKFVGVIQVLFRDGGKKPPIAVTTLRPALCTSAWGSRPFDFLTMKVILKMIRLIGMNAYNNRLC